MYLLHHLFEELGIAESQDVATQLLEAFNSADWERFRGLLGPDAVYQETGTGRRVTGEGYVELCQGWRETFPDCVGEVRTTIAQGNQVAQQVHWTGTHQGVLRGPNLELPATGKSVEIDATLWTRVENGKVVEQHHHLDVLTMLGQIGALPS